MTADDLQADPFEEMRERLSLDLAEIVAARKEAEGVLEQLEKILETSLTELRLPSTVSLVVFGSLARREWTSGSDVDWTLLVDGPADPEHFTIATRIADALQDSELTSPGSTRTFGTLISSHELIHNIGGLEDTNQNMTRRILLLLESCAVVGADIRTKVLKAILNRYLVCGPGVSDPSDTAPGVPRFLLNDVVRLWRTFAVDYAAKKWERSDKGWALRNIKLRVPRKLTFSKGLLLCLDRELFSGTSHWPADEESESDLRTELLVNRYAALCELSPLDLLSRLLLSFSSKETATSLLTGYNDYLGIVNDTKLRKHLDEDVEFENAMNDPQFRNARNVSRGFGNAMQKLFFEESDELTQLTQKYGVF